MDPKEKIKRLDNQMRFAIGILLLACLIGFYLIGGWTAVIATLIAWAIIIGIFFGAFKLGGWIFKVNKE